jgi:HD-GYP domain-containing protein (c-di-GMP phosphodiesterase class II)
MGYDMLKHIVYFKGNSILDMVLHHHERYDGKGYPQGLKGENIPLVARIMAVADAFDAMTSKRIYRDMKDIEYAIEQLERGKQSQFDPEIAEVFLQLIKSKKNNHTWDGFLTKKRDKGPVPMSRLLKSGVKR